MKHSYKKLLLLIIAFIFATAAFPTMVLCAREKPVVIVDFSFDSSQFQNRLAGFIIEHGYGRKVDYLFTESMPGFMGIERGDADLTMESWVTNIPEWWQKVQADGTVVSLGKTFPDAPQGWYVPTYIIKGDKKRGIKPLAPDLKSVMDLPKYWELFKDSEVHDKGRLYTCPSGWVCNSINSAKLKSYGLDKNYLAFDPGSGTSLATVIMAAYKKGQPILTYYWEPTAIMGMIDMTMLEEPPFDEALWEGTYNCAYPPSTVLILANTKFIAREPEIAAFLERYQTTLKQANSGLSYMKQHNVKAEKAVLWFLKENREDWKKWVVDEAIIAKVEAALVKGK